MDFLLSLVLLLIAAKLFGELSERLGFPSMLGYLLSGMLVGGFGLMQPDESIVLFGELGAILLLFVAGMRELETASLVENRNATYASAVLGFVFTALVITALAVYAPMIDARVYFDFPAMAALVTCLSVSSVVASMKVLIRTGKLNTGFGRVMLSTGVMDALFGLAVFTLLSVFLPAGMAGGVNVLAKIISIALMLVVLFVLGENIVPKVMQYAEALKVEEAQFTLAFVVMLVLATVVRVFGLHGIIGAFIAGIIVSRSAARDGGFSEKLASLSYGVFVPIFFAWVGMLAFSQYQLPFWSVFIPVLAVGVFLANFIGRAVGALIGGFDARQAMLVGLGMVPRGGVGLVILAAMATTTGVTGFVYSTILLVVLASVLVSPLFMLASMKEKAI